MKYVQMKKNQFFCWHFLMSDLGQQLDMAEKVLTHEEIMWQKKNNFKCSPIESIIYASLLRESCQRLKKIMWSSNWIALLTIIMWKCKNSHVIAASLCLNGSHKLIKCSQICHKSRNFLNRVFDHSGKFHCDCLQL